MQSAYPLIRASRDPKIEILELKEDFIRFILTDTDPSVANALRRVMIGETPTMAIDLVEIEENSSVLHDEFLAHRLGLIPIRVHSKEGVAAYQYKRHCWCDDGRCPSCSVELELNVTHDGTEPVRVVTSNELVCPDGKADAIRFTTTEEAYFTEHNESSGITIVKLAPGQSVKAKCTAVKGISKMHAKWCPVSVATFAYDPRIELNEAFIDELTNEQKRQLVDSCPTKVFGLDQSTGKITVENRADCMFCDECTKLGDTWKKTYEEDNVVSITTEPNRFIFSVETTGALRPEEVVFSALQVLTEKLQKLETVFDDILKRGLTQVDLEEGQGGFVDTGGFI